MPRKYEKVQELLPVAKQLREEIEEAKKEKGRAYHRQYSREYRAKILKSNGSMTA